MAKVDKFEEEVPVERLHRSYLNSDGSERCNSTPVAVPVKFRSPPTIADQVVAALRSERARAAAMGSGAETLEEANDFDTGEDDDHPRSKYEERLEEGINFDSDREFARGPARPKSKLDAIKQGVKSLTKSKQKHAKKVKDDSAEPSNGSDDSSQD